MAASTIFEEDEVYKSTEKGLVCGLVVESSEYISTDEDDEEDAFFEKIKKGSVRVVWHPEGKEEVVPEKNVKLADRSLMPGDVVRRLIEGQDSQRGYVRNTTVTCHLQITGKNKVISNVESSKLQPQIDWEADQESGDVFLDSWVGRIEAVVENITFRLPDGARCALNDEDHFNELCQLEDLQDTREADSEFYNSNFYQGEKLKGTLSLLEPAKWIKQTKAHSPHTAKKNGDKEIVLTVEETSAKSLEVHWLCRGYAKAELPCGSMTAPPRTLKKDDIARLKKLDCFEACSAQIGDKAFYTITEQDRVEMITPKGNRPLVHYMLNREKTTVSVHELNTANQKNEAEPSENGKQGTADQSELKTAKTLVKPPEVHPETAKSAEPTGTKPDAKQEDPVPALVNVDIEKDESTAAEIPLTIEDVDSCDSEYEDEGDDEYQSDTGSVASGASARSGTSTSSLKKKKPKKKGVAMQIRTSRKKKVKRAKKAFDRHHRRDQLVGERVPVEIIHTQSVAEVMWQDGHIEQNIPSTDLFPIHHLDELEFFPGDFVVPLSETSEVESYGVVEKVDHAGRTCMIRWMKPYLVGKANKPDERIVSEEVSVYDIKDHPDYKFRPGNVVVRVGGYEGSSMLAAGQVYELRQDGCITIQWVDKTRSACYPQELYLLGDELSDLNDSDLESDTEDDDSDFGGTTEDSEADSWQTEEEEEGDEADVEAEDAKEKESEDKLCVGPEKKVELDQLLETAKTTLKKLEDTFSQNIEIGCCTIHCYKEMLQIYRHCHYLDRLLSSQYFENTELQEVISNIKQELKKERAAKLARQVSEKYESNRNMVQEAAAKNSGEVKVDVRSSGNDGGLEGATSVASGGGSSHGTQTIAMGTNTQAEMNTQTEEVPKCDTELSTTEDEVCTSQPPVDMTQLHDVATQALDMVEMSAQSVQNEIEIAQSIQHELEKRTLRLEVEDLRKQIASVGVKCQESTGTQTAGHLVDSPAADGTKLDCDKSVQTESDTLKAEAAAAKSTCDKSVGTECLAKVLCQRACHLVAVQIVKVQNDLEKKWEMLKQSGMLRVLEEEEDQEEEEDVTKEMDSMIAAVLDCFGDVPTIETPKKAETDKSQLKLDLDGTAAASPEVAFLLKSPVTPQTPLDVKAKLEYNVDGFTMLESVDSVYPNHKFKSNEHAPTEPKSFLTAVKKEMKLLHTSLPKGIFVKGYEDRMDLLTVMITGPTNTPYEDGLFFFDVQLPNDYPNNPPVLHFLSYCNERLNPNLYEDGKVCVSLLGTWTGKGTEVWTSKSSLMQVLISIQALILVSEPYYNEAGYEKQKGSQQGLENSRMYNEMAILKLVQAMTKTVKNPPIVFAKEVLDHMTECGARMIKRLECWINSSSEPGPSSSSSGASLPPDPQGAGDTPQLQKSSPGGSTVQAPEFPLLPVSRGFTLTLAKYLELFRVVLQGAGIAKEPPTSSTTPKVHEKLLV